MPLFVMTLAVACAVAVAAPRAAGWHGRDAAATYAGKCAVCHGKAGAGDGAAAAALERKPTNFTTAAFQKNTTDEQIAAAIKDGKSSMPAFGKQLSAAEIKELVAYVRSFGSQKS